MKKLLAGRGSPIFNGLVSGPILNFRDVFFDVFGGFLPLLETVLQSQPGKPEHGRSRKKRSKHPLLSVAKKPLIGSFWLRVVFPIPETNPASLPISLLGRWYLSSFGALERPIFRGFCCLVSGNVPHDIFWIAFYFWTPLTPQPLILVL